MEGLILVEGVIIMIVALRPEVVEPEFLGPTVTQVDRPRAPGCGIQLAILAELTKRCLAFSRVYRSMSRSSMPLEDRQLQDRRYRQIRYSSHPTGAPD